MPSDFTKLGSAKRISDAQSLIPKFRPKALGLASKLQSDLTPTDAEVFEDVKSRGEGKGISIRQRSQITRFDFNHAAHCHGVKKVSIRKIYRCEEIAYPRKSILSPNKITLSISRPYD